MVQGLRVIQNLRRGEIAQDVSSPRAAGQGSEVIGPGARRRKKRRMQLHPKGTLTLWFAYTTEEIPPKGSTNRTPPITLVTGPAPNTEAFPEDRLRVPLCV